MPEKRAPYSAAGSRRRRFLVNATEAEIEKIDAVRGNLSRAAFVLRAALAAADQETQNDR